jgi:hypothetical protein
MPTRRYRHRHVHARRTRIFRNRKATALDDTQICHPQPRLYTDRVVLQLACQGPAVAAGHRHALHADVVHLPPRGWRRPAQSQSQNLPAPSCLCLETARKPLVSPRVKTRARVHITHAPTHTPLRRSSHSAHHNISYIAQGPSLTRETAGPSIISGIWPVWAMWKRDQSHLPPAGEPSQLESQPRCSPSCRHSVSATSPGPSLPHSPLLSLLCRQEASHPG